MACAWKQFRARKLPPNHAPPRRRSRRALAVRREINQLALLRKLCVIRKWASRTCKLCQSPSLSRLARDTPNRGRKSASSSSSNLSRRRSTNFNKNSNRNNKRHHRNRRRRPNNRIQSKVLNGINKNLMRARMQDRSSLPLKWSVSCSARPLLQAPTLPQFIPLRVLLLRCLHLLPPTQRYCIFEFNFYFNSLVSGGFHRPSRY